MSSPNLSFFDSVCRFFVTFAGLLSPTCAKSELVGATDGMARYLSQHASLREMTPIVY